MLKFRKRRKTYIDDWMSMDGQRMYFKESHIPKVRGNNTFVMGINVCIELMPLAYF